MTFKQAITPHIHTQIQNKNKNMTVITWHNKIFNQSNVYNSKVDFNCLYGICDKTQMQCEVMQEIIDKPELVLYML